MSSPHPFIPMAGLGAAIHDDPRRRGAKGVDARPEAGHDEESQ